MVQDAEETENICSDNERHWEQAVRHSYLHSRTYPRDKFVRVVAILLSDYLL